MTPGQGTTPSAPNGAPPALAANIAVQSASGYGQKFSAAHAPLEPYGAKLSHDGKSINDANNLGHPSGLGAGFTMNPWMYMYNPLLALQQLNQVQQRGIFLG